MKQERSYSEEDMREAFKGGSKISTSPSNIPLKPEEQIITTDLK